MIARVATMSPPERNSPLLAVHRLVLSSGDGAVPRGAVGGSSDVSSEPFCPQFHCPTLGLLSDLQGRKLFRRQVTLDRAPHQVAKPHRVDGVEFSGDFAEVLRPAVCFLRRTGRQRPSLDLLWIDGKAREVDVCEIGELPKISLDLVGGIPAARIEIAQMVDNGRTSDLIDGLASRMKKRQARISSGDHKRHVVFVRHVVDDACERIFFQPYFDVTFGAGP